MIGSDKVADIVRDMDFHDSFSWVRDNPDCLKKVCEQARFFPSYALPDPDNPVAVVGIIPSFGVGEAWMVTSKDFKGRVAYTVLEQQKQLCAAAIKVFSLNRLHMAVDPEHRHAREWAAAGGFVFDVPYRNGGIFGQDLELWVFQHEGKRR